MKIELKDVLHLYIGCEIKSELMGVQHKFTDFSPRTLPLFEKGSFKLILRPLLSMREEEAMAVGYNDANEFLQMIDEVGEEWRIGINDYLFLLRQHFDLFGLIESGQAINKTTLTH